jgi:hypothetical protein
MTTAEAAPVDDLCSECRHEVAAFEVDGTAVRLGYRCLNGYIAATRAISLDDLIAEIMAPPPLSPQELMRRLRKLEETS